MRIAICLPSRGLVHSRTIEAIQRTVALAQVSHPDVVILTEWIISHDRPIPDAHNAVVETALERGADTLFFVEEDNLPPEQALPASIDLLNRGFDLAFVDYPVQKAPDSTCFHRSVPLNRIVWTGLGCTLIRSEIFAGLAYPWFRTDTSLLIHNFGKHNETLTPTRTPTDWGGQDVFFGWSATNAGYQFGVVDGLRGGQARLLKYGSVGTNRGVHEIEIWR